MPPTDHLLLWKLSPLRSPPLFIKPTTGVCARQLHFNLPLFPKCTPNSAFRYAYINGSHVGEVLQNSFDPKIFAANQIISTDYNSSIPANRTAGIDEVLKVT